MATKVAALNTAENTATDTLTTSKKAAADVVSGWATDKSKYADQDQTKLDKIEADAKNLNGLAAADNTSATAKTIDAARKQLQDDIKVVNDLRQAAVTAANTAVTDVEQHKDELTDRIAAVEDAMSTGTQQAIEKAVEDLKAANTVATNTVVPTNMSDDDGVTAAKDAVTAALNAKTYDADAVADKVTALKTAENTATDTLTTSKKAAADVVNGWATDKSKYADQDQTKLDKIEADAKNLNGLAAADNTSATAKTIEAARNALQKEIDAINGLRQAAVTEADTVVANGLKHKDKLTDRIAVVKDVETTGTASDIAEAVAKLQTADATVVPTNISNDDDVVAAKDAVDKALNATDYKQADVDTAKKAYDNAVEQAKAKLDASKKSAADEAKAWDDEAKLYADQTEHVAVIDKAINNLKDLTDNADTKKSEIDAARDKLRDAIAVVTGERGEKVDEGNTVVKENEANANADDEVKTTVDNLKDAIASGTAKAIKEAIDKVKTAVDTMVAANISDSDKVNAAKKAVNDLLNAAGLDADKVTAAVTKLTDATNAAKKDLQTAKDAAKADTDSWETDAHLYADQKDAKTVRDAATALKILTGDNGSTKKTIDAARDDLQAAIKKVADVRQAAVDKADAAVVAVKNGDDVKTRVEKVKAVEQTGTASDIAEAVAKLQKADATVVPTNISDDGDVKVAKDAVDKALNATDCKQADVDTAKKAYDNAVEQAKAKLDSSKKNAADEAKAWDDEAKLYADQTDQVNVINNAINNLKGLTDKADTKKSDIDAARKQLQDAIAVVTGARDEKVNEGNTVVKENEANAKADAEVNTTVDNLKKVIVSGTKNAIKEAIDKVKTAVDTIVAANISDSDKVKAAKNAVNDILNATGLNAEDLTKAVAKLTDTVDAAKKDLQATKQDAANDENSWNTDKSKYADQTTTDVEGAITHLNDLTSDGKSTKTDIDAARDDLQAAIKKVADVRQSAVDKADDAAVAVKNGDNDDVNARVAAVKAIETTGTASDIAKAVAKLQTADATVVPANISDDADVTAAKKAVDNALNNDGDADTAKKAYDKAVATAQATLKQAVADANAVKVPANLQDQVEVAKKNKLDDVDQKITDLQKSAGQDDTTATTLRSDMADVQGRLDDMTAKLNTTRDAAQKLVDQTADATDTNVVAARDRLTDLLTNKDTTTMTDLQNAMNVLTATSKPATANVVETPKADVKSGQVATTVADGDAAFAIVTDADGKQTVVPMTKTADGTATANVPGATGAKVVTVSKNGNKPFIFVTDGSGTAQYTELTPNGAKTTITPDGSTTKTADGIDVPAGAVVDVIYLPTAEVSVQAGVKNVDVPGKTGYTATVTDAQGNEVKLTADRKIAVDGVPAGTNYLVTYTPKPAKVVVKLGTDSGFAEGEAPAAGNAKAQTLKTIEDALKALQKDDATLAAIVSTGYTDTKVNVTNAVEAMNQVDQNLNVEGYAHRIQAPDGTQYDSLEAAVKANPTFAAGTTQMKVVYAPLDGQKIQVKDADGTVLGTVTGKSDAEINVDDFKSVDADLQAKAEKGNLKMTVTAPDGKTYDSLMAALQATGYFDHLGLENGASSFDLDGSGVTPEPVFDEAGNIIGYQAVLAEAASLNDMNIQDFVVSFAPANDGVDHNNTDTGDKIGSSVADNNQNGEQVNVAGPANGSRDGSEANNATVAGQTAGSQVAGSQTATQTGATANTTQNVAWQAQGAAQNADNNASLLAAAGNEQAKTANAADARITELPETAAVIQDSIVPLESAKQAMNLTGRVTENNFLVVIAAMVASGLFGLLLAFWRRRKEDDQATR